MGKIAIFFKKIYRFITRDIWRIADNELSRGRRFLYRFVKVIVISFRGFSQDKLVVRASALTYSIMFAIVPLISLFIAIGKGFGVENIIENWLHRVLIAQSELIPFIMEFVEKYLETAQGGLFIGIGIAILLISVMNFFKQSEKAFNSIWQVNKSRSFVRQFSTYFSALFLVPVMVVLISGLSIFLNKILNYLQLTNILSPFLQFGVKFMPYLISWIVFTLVYIIIPNTRVKITSGIVAGVIAGTAFQFFQMLYIEGQGYLSRYNMVYGSFAAIPLLLLWLQISCLIVLFGAEISYAFQNLQNYEYEGESNSISIRYKKFLSLFLTYVIVKRFENKQSPLRNDRIAATYKLPIRLVNQLLSELTANGIITEIRDDELKTKSYQPAMDINQLTVDLFVNKFESYGSELFLANKHPELDRFWKKHLEMVKNAPAPEAILLKDL
ncbi:MAG: YihY/virulence factor BrkB family protein [Bacteroidales bacterium]|jgi:membrane protein|nr:YihY/virulence factor BrkB family protein [Bacteroidales bacterium]